MELRANMKRSAYGVTVGMIMAVMMGGGMSSVAIAASEDTVITIQDAYNAALGTNEFVKISEESVVQSEDRVDQAWTYLYPRLVARAAYTRFNDTLPSGGGPFLFQPTELFQTALVLTQPLYTGGRTLAALRSAEKMRESSKSGLSTAKRDIILRVSEAYYGALKAEKSIDISKRSLERMEHHKLVTEKEAATRRTKSNASALLRANTLVSQARISLVRAQDTYKVAQEKLSLLTKLPLNARLSEPQSLPLPSDSLAALQETALQNRDDYLESKTNQSIAAEYVTIVRGGHYPQIYAEAGVTYQDSHPAMVTDATVYYGGLRLQVPLFEGGLMKSEVSEARSKQRQAELGTDYLKKTIESDVHEALVNLQTVSSVLETAKLQVDYAKANFDAVEGLFAEGLVTSLSLIDAEQALSMAERELMNALYDQQVAIIRLRKNTGTLGKES